MPANRLADISVRGGAKPTVVQGTIGFVDNQVDKTTGTVTARVIAENADEVLWPGLSAEVALTVETKRGMLAVPATAVLPAQQGMIAWVIGPDNKVAPRTVTVERIVRLYGLPQRRRESRRARRHRRADPPGARGDGEYRGAATPAGQHAGVGGA